MAIDTAHHSLLSGCRSGVIAISDYQAGRIVTTMPIGTGVDGAGFDGASGNAFASNADGTLTVIHQDAPDQYHVAETVKTPQGRAIWGSTPRITACSSSPRSLGRRPRGRLAGAEDRCCPDHSQ